VDTGVDRGVASVPGIDLPYNCQPKQRNYILKNYMLLEQMWMYKTNPLLLILTYVPVSIRQKIRYFATTGIQIRIHPIF
jgi:hypothetical protein